MKIVFDDAISLAFFDHRPLFSGHCLIVTKGHHATQYDLPADLIGPLFLNARMLGQTVQLAMRADGTFVAMNTLVSQSVPHFHIHIVRADAAFAKPEICETLEERGVNYAIRLPANDSLLRDIDSQRAGRQHDVWRRRWNSMPGNCSRSWGLS